MAFKNINATNDYEFSQILHRFVTPAEPITTPDRLFGRNDELKRINRALLDPGMQIFIIGARGVGKTSLANTAASFYQSSDAEFVKVSCAEDTTYKSLIANIASKVLNRSKAVEISEKTTRTVNGNFAIPFLKGLSASGGKSNETNIKEIDIADQIQTVSDALQILSEISKLHSVKPVIVVDEVDRMELDNIRPLSDIIKGISDQQINIKFIFTAVARTFELIFGSHESTRRQLEIIELPALSWESRICLVEETLRQFDVEIDRTAAIRIAAISDGFPHYIHYVLKKLLWNIYEAKDVITEVDIQDYNKALRDSVESLSTEYAAKYNKAINSKNHDCELVLWSTSIGEWIINSLDEMYSAYREIVYTIHGYDYVVIEKSKFNAFIRNLTKESHGSILTNSHSGKRGEYEFSEKIFKGYIRIQAELHSIDMKGIDEKGLIKPVLVNWSSVPLARTGYRQSQQPHGYPRSSFQIG